MTIGNRIRERRRDLGMTQTELAKKVGLKTKGAISRIENDTRDLTQTQIVDFAKALNSTPSYLIGWDKTDLDTIINRHPDLHPIRKIRSVPILGTIACGTPIWAEENFEGYVGIDPAHMDGEFALICKGDSMVDAEIHDGDIVLMKKVSDVEDGQIAAVLIEDETTLKRVYRKENLLVLQPCNRNYSPIIYSYEEVEDNGIQIIGECVGVYHPKKRNL